jgi:hypothetical protein
MLECLVKGCSLRGDDKLFAGWYGKVQEKQVGMCRETMTRLFQGIVTKEQLNRAARWFEGKIFEMEKAIAEANSVDAAVRFLMGIPEEPLEILPWYDPAPKRSPAG